MECSKCGVSDEKEQLFDVISAEGIIKLCKRCSFEEQLPIINQSSMNKSSSSRYNDFKAHRKQSSDLDKNLAKEERGQTVYTRLSHMAGINPEEHKQRIHSSSLGKRELFPKQDSNFKKIADSTLNIHFSKTSQKTFGLINNFNWIIMRVRRLKHLTQKQLAEAISESEAMIKMAEQGRIPEGNFSFINKLENYLGINIVEKPDVINKNRWDTIQQSSEKKLGFDSATAKNITISDLQEMKKESKTPPRPYWRERLFGKKTKDSKIVEENQEVSKDEIEKVEKD